MLKCPRYDSYRMSGVRADLVTYKEFLVVTYFVEFFHRAGKVIMDCGFVDCTISCYDL